MGLVHTEVEIRNLKHDSLKLATVRASAWKTA